VGQHKQTARPEAEWLRLPAPHLRIVPEDLWQATHARLDTSRASYLRATDGRLYGRPGQRDIESPYLLSGFARCAICGQAMIVRSRSHGRKRAYFYACIRFHKRGPEACGNHMDMPLKVLDESVIAAIGEDVLDADAIEQAVRKAIDLLAPGARKAEAERLRGELATLDAEMERLTNAIAGGGDPEILNAAIRQRQTKRTELEAKLATAEHLAVTVDVKAIRAKVISRMKEWRKALTGHVAQARQVLRKFGEGPIELEPLPDGSGVRVRGQAALGRILAGIVELPTLNDSPLDSVAIPDANSINVSGAESSRSTRLASPRGRWLGWRGVPRTRVTGLASRAAA
jgi:hypothetical protein